MKKSFTDKIFSGFTDTKYSSFRNPLKFILSFICCLLVVQAMAVSQKINLDLGRVPLKHAFQEIKKQTAYDFFYSDNELDVEQLVEVHIEEQGIVEAVKQLVGKHFSVEIQEENIILISPKKVQSQVELITPPIKVQGKVTNEKGEGLPGVYVLIKGSGVGTLTNLEGNFGLTVDEDATLVFSFVGYITEEIAVSGSGEINLQMTPSLTELDEVVVNGIFERNSESYTGSTATVTEEEIRKVGNNNVLQAIQNIEPAMIILDDFAAGSNPNRMPDVQIRGASTFPADGNDDYNNLKGNYLRDPNQPLFILDGFEVTIQQVSDLDINRVSSITILKDASAKAVYGSKAANGVVVIETKSLSSLEPLISYNANVDIEMPDLSSYNLTNAEQKLEAERIDGVYQIISKSQGYEDQVALDQLYNSRRKLIMEGLNTDWLSIPLRAGIGQRHSLGVELGQGDLKMLANLWYRKANGVMKDSYRETIEGSMTTSYRLKNLLFRNIMTMTGNNSQESPYGTFDEYARMNPYWIARNPDGSIPYYADTTDVNNKITNPLYNSTVNSRNESQYTHFTNNFYLEWDILPTFTAVTRVGLTLNKSEADEFYPSNHTMFEHITDPLEKGSYQLNNGGSRYITADVNLRYTNTMGKHFYFVNGGFNISDRQFDETVITAQGFTSGRAADIIFARGYPENSRPSRISGLSKDVGFLLVGSYVYDDRLLTDVTLRTSASSQFGDDKRWANFWSLGLGYNLHNEDFMPEVFKQLKVRGSVGTSGNQNFNTNASIATYAYYTDKLYQDFAGSYLLNMANSGLQWESKLDYNAGFDSRIGNMSLRFDYYESYTENMTTDVSIPYSTGFGSVKENLGRVRNSGVELAASYMVWARNQNFVSLNLSLISNENEIMELSDAMRNYNEAQDRIAEELGNNEPVHKYEEGGSLNDIWAVRSLGIDPANGNEIYLDRDGNITYEWKAQNMVIAGNTNSTYRGNFGLNAEYRGFGVNVVCRYLAGGQYYNQTLIDKVENVDMRYNVDERVLTGRWLTPGQHALYKRLGVYSMDTDGDGVADSGELQKMTRATSRFVQDRNEVQIAAVSFYYEFSKDFLLKTPFKRLRLMTSMNDVATFSTIQIERGTSYPYAKTLSFSLLANL